MKTLALAALLGFATVPAAHAQWVTLRVFYGAAPVVVAPSPVYYAPAPVVTYRPVFAPAPVVVRSYSPVVATRFRPVLGGAVQRVRYAPTRYVGPLW
ncbi:MAG: hypothetical protein ACRCT8_15610 [Lacipirellulaceae bacterium]